MEKTGGIITAAGVIMAIAFSGLLLSSMPCINQLSFYLVFAVLFDTFVIRTVLVPALLDLFGFANFWSGSLRLDINTFLFFLHSI